MNEILLKMVEHWGWVILLYFFTSWIKLISSVWLKAVELRVLNKNHVRVEISDTHQLFEIQSSTINIQDLEKLNPNKLIENKRAG